MDQHYSRIGDTQNEATQSKGKPLQAVQLTRNIPTKNGHHPQKHRHKSAGTEDIELDEEDIMGWRCQALCFLLFQLACLLTYLAEIGLHLAVAMHLYRQGELLWFSVLGGFLLVPTVAEQLLSLLWFRLGPSWSYRILVVGCHCLQLGLPLRYVRLMLGMGTRNTKKQLYLLSVLRVLHAFCSSMPILLTETYLLVVHFNGIPFDPLSKILLVAASWLLVSICWTLATHRKRPEYFNALDTIFAWPGTFFKFTWRLGEVSGRTLVLALFAGLHGMWVLLVLGLHWITMLAWLLTEHCLRARSTSKTAAKDLGTVLLTSYLYTFSYLNLKPSSSKYRFMLFYLIMCMENATLLVVWLAFDTQLQIHVPIAIAIGSAYAFALTAAVIYYNCFHLKFSPDTHKQPDTLYIQQCINCRLSCCVKHSAKRQRPFPQWWVEVKESLGPDHYDQLLPSEYTGSRGASPHPNLMGSRSATPGPLATDPLQNRPLQKAWLPISQLSRPLQAYNNGAFENGHCDSSGYTTTDTSVTSFTTSGRSRLLSDDLDDSGSFSDYIWDDYDLLEGVESGNDGPCTCDRAHGNEVHQRSDSGFSATLSGGSNLNNGDIPPRLRVSKYDHFVDQINQDTSHAIGRQYVISYQENRGMQEDTSFYSYSSDNSSIPMRHLGHRKHVCCRNCGRTVTPPCANGADCLAGNRPHKPRRKLPPTPLEKYMEIRRQLNNNNEPLTDKLRRDLPSYGSTNSSLVETDAILRRISAIQVAGHRTFPVPQGSIAGSDSDTQTMSL